MLKLHVGYFVCGLTTGLILLFHFLTSLPDGKLHIVFCDVGQGDAAYVRFPDGRDMLVDGGPNDRVFACLGKHMPFWDRSLDLVVLTHPQNDHLQGLLSVVDRYEIGAFVRSDLRNNSEGFSKLLESLESRHVVERLVTTGSRIGVSGVNMQVVWPSREQIAHMSPPGYTTGTSLLDSRADTLGISTGDLNEGSVVFWLTFGDFDALFSGDADTHVESRIREEVLADKSVELLKVPHHGSKTGISKERIDRINPEVAVISVGKNSYGHPSPELLSDLANESRQVLRTDQEGDIEIVSDGERWFIK